MRILIDTDMFCKLGVGSLLHDGIRLLGAGIADCARLAALPYMLRRGRLPRQYGTQACLDLLPLAAQMSTIPAAGSVWLDRLVPIQAINPGEAQLFAIAAERGSTVMTGDNAALQALKVIDGFPAALAGRIVSNVAILLALCEDLGPERVRRGVAALTSVDKTIRVCFSEGNPGPREALESYCRSLESELHPLVLWKPRPVGGA